jgi:hypothetical protein
MNDRNLIRRTTAMTDAFVAAAAKLGIDLTKARLPVKREPTWSVTRKPKRRG